MTKIEIILTDEYRDSDFIALLEVSSEKKTDEKELFNEVNKLFAYYKSRNPEDWTVEGFIESLKEHYTVRYDMSPRVMSV